MTRLSSRSLRHAPHAPNRWARTRAARLLATCLGTALCAASFIAVSPAEAATFPGPVTFSYTGGEQSYTVPADVYLIQIEAVGGNGSPDATHGVGMDLYVGLPVTPGEVLYAEVGAAGGVSTFGGGAPGAPGAGSGGGASDVRTCSLTAVSCPGDGTSSDSRLVVAGGGGGGGAPPPADDFGSTCGDSGSGGSASLETTPVMVAGGTVLPGDDASGNTPAILAQGGQSSSPGNGGTTPDCNGFAADFGGAVSGSNGVGANGGDGAAPVDSPPGGGGGGGAGGYYGGGGGASGQTETAPIPNHSASDGGGGGAGASFYSSTVNGDITVGHNGTDTPPSITITPLIGIASPPDGATYALGQVVDASFTCQPLDGGCSDFTVANGAPIDTSVVGVHSFFVSGFNATATVHYTVAEPPSITSANMTTMTVGHAASYGITTGTSYPASPSLSDGGASLPAGVVFADKANGSATLAGTPSAGTAGTYHFTITASNGISPDATQSFTLVVTDVPGAPTGIALKPASGAVALSWHAPSRDGNSAITGYTATATPGGATCTVAGALHCTITGLAPATWYTMSVAATNLVGTGQRSSTSSAYPATASSLTLWAVPRVAAKKALFELGAIGAVPGSTVDVAIPNEARVSCVADLAGQCRVEGRESRAGAWRVSGSSRGKESHVTIYVPLVRAPATEKVGRTASVDVSHCPAGASVAVHTSDGRSFTVKASSGGDATIHVVAKAKGVLTVTVTVNGVTVGSSTLTVS